MITKDDSWETIEAALSRYDCMPEKPKKPIQRGVEPADFRAHADALEAYEKEFDEYRKKKAEADEIERRKHDVWLTKLREEYSGFNDAAFAVIYSKAYEDGHSSGYYNIRQHMDDLAQFVTDVFKAEDLK